MTDGGVSYILTLLSVFFLFIFCPYTLATFKIVDEGNYIVVTM